MPYKVRMIIAVCCVVVAIHTAAILVLNSPCYATLLLSVGVILGCSLGVLAHFRTWTKDGYKEAYIPMTGGLYGSSLITGILITLFCLFGPSLVRIPSTITGLPEVLLLIGYFASYVAITLAYPPTTSSEWSIAKQEAIECLRFISFAFVLAILGPIVVACAIARTFELGTTASFLLVGVASIFVVASFTGWNIDTFDRRRALCQTAFNMSIVLGALVWYGLYLMGFEQGEVLLASKALVAGVLCSLPIFWRNKESYVWELFALGLVVLVGVLAYLRWAIQIMPLGAGVFFLILPIPTLLQIFIWPRLRSAPRERKLSEVL